MNDDIPNIRRKAPTWLYAVDGTLMWDQGKYDVVLVTVGLRVRCFTPTYDHEDLPLNWEIA